MRIGKIIRKTKNDFVFCGIQILHPRVLMNLSIKFSLKIYSSLIKSGRIYGTIDNNTWFHISTPEDLNCVNRWMKKNKFRIYDFETSGGHHGLIKYFKQELLFMTVDLKKLRKLIVQR